MIKHIIWDFDGVILNSNKVRDLGFERVLKDYPAEQVQQLLAFHRTNGGLSRYIKFEYFFTEVRKEAVKKNKVIQLSAKFSEIMRALLVNPNLLIADTINFIKKYHKQYQMHIASGSDENELRFLCERLGIKNYFISIHGSPLPKTMIVNNILQTYKYSNEETCLIGDSRNDIEAAMSNEISFYGYNNLALKSEGKYLKDYTTFIKEFKLQ